MDEETELMSTAPRARAARSLALIIALAAGATPASAQDLFSWLWGGGYRSEVSFHPSVQPRQIIVSFGDRKLYWVQGRGQAISYPIAIPREQSRWSGVTNVTMKRENPSWTPTPTMRAENPRLPMWVPGGHPMNPLGVRALYLGSSAYRIHGTDAPWTIGSAVSKGCIRMYNQDVLDLYPRVRVGTKVTVTWNSYGSSGAIAQARSSEERAERPRKVYSRYQSIPIRRATKPTPAATSAGE
jgi:lipoprotein-anchoring transpeptidase ErfK/SrfK